MMCAVDKNIAIGYIVAIMQHMGAVMTVKKVEVVQINIRVRRSTKEALEQTAEEDRRSMADEADVLIMEAIEARRAAKKEAKR